MNATYNFIIVFQINPRDNAMSDTVNFDSEFDETGTQVHEKNQKCYSCIGSPKLKMSFLLIPISTGVPT